MTSMVTLAELDTASFRAAMAHFPTGVTLIAQGTPPDLEVMTANSFMSVSLQPMLVLISVQLGSRMRLRLDQTDTFAVHVLHADQQELAAVFARHDRPSGLEAARLLTEPVASFECVQHARHRAGDHVLYLGRVTAIRVSPEPAPSLLFHRGMFGSTT
ncbi:monooxygenase [Rhizocola hellebori]|uniref:Monooxygenase n=1 Tax=Rhizocola hellebori TaxID=1392758 RepID=A0A8J3QEL3_9ACTN|nr:flavin reductase family protein [Rhizocola hellebori]GIH08213.1 monooxygenase [Rhizocola hellebori]